MGVNFAGGRTFSDPDRSFSNLDAALIASLVTASADIAFLVDVEGRVLDVAMRDEVCPPSVYREWIGRPFVETVTSECRLKAKRLLGDAGSQNSARREINHPVPGAADLPVSYSILPLTQNGAKIALGRDLRTVSDLQQKLMSAQIAYDHELERIRDVEAQYRLLFETSAEAHLVIDPGNRRIVEANASAKARFGASGSGDIVGRNIETFLAEDGLPVFDALVATAFSSGRTERGTLQLKGEPRDSAMVALRFFRHLGASRLSLQLVSDNGQERSEFRRSEDLLARLGRQSPDAIALLDEEMRVVLVNESLLDLIQIADAAQALGRPFANWIGSRGLELTVLKNAVDQQGFLRNLSTQLRPVHGPPLPVEVSGTAVERDGVRYYGLSIRQRKRSQRSPEEEMPQIPDVRPANEMIGLVGQMPLRDIVRDTTEIIEKLCIEAALELTGNNRASASEILGLSRQALYTKLRRYGIGGDRPGQPDDSDPSLQ